MGGRLTMRLINTLIAGFMLTLTVAAPATTFAEPRTARQATMSELGAATEGAGENFCKNVNALYAAAPDKAEAIYANWLAGFLSGLNSAFGLFGKGQIHDLTAWSMKSQTRRLRDYCEDHPDGIYLAGAFELWKALPLAPKAIPPLIPQQ